MKGRNKADREAARAEKRKAGKPLVSKYASKGGGYQYEFQKPRAGGPR